MMKDKTFKLLFSGVLSSFIALTTSLVSFSYAWFKNKDIIQEAFVGKSYGSYFAYGNGTAEKPYGITRPLHLYNLAWLQYLGHFNQLDESGKLKQQFHFELGDDFDASTLTLPPIGTTENPFVGTFNGNGKTIKGLKIANTRSELNAPSAVKSISDQGDSYFHILGLFGVVGEYKPAVTGSSPYASVTPEIKNFTLMDATVSDTNSASGEQNQVLMGLAAGYVNGVMSDVAISNSSSASSALKIKNEAYAYTSGSPSFACISKYSLVGYCEPEYENAVEKMSYSVSSPETQQKNFVANGQGSKAGWGGGIDMKSINTRLQDIRDKYCDVGTRSHPYYYDRTYNISSSGVKTETDKGNWQDGNDQRENSGIGEARLYNSDFHSAAYNPKIGNYNFHYSNDRTDKESASKVENIYTMLDGGYYQRANIYREEVETRYYSAIVSSNGGSDYFLSLLGNGSLGYEENAENPYVWKMPSSGDYGTISQVRDGTEYYLINDAGSLKTTTDSSLATDWYVDPSSKIYSILNGKTYYLHFTIPSETGATAGWSLVERSQFTSGSTFLISSGSNYLKIKDSRNGVENTTNPWEATRWTIENNQNEAKVYTTVDSTRYYLVISVSYSWTGSTASVGVSTSSNSNLRFSSSSLSSTVSLYYYSRWSDDYYLTFNNSNWTASGGTSSVTLVSLQGATSSERVEVRESTNPFETIRREIFDHSESKVDYSGNENTFSPINAYTTQEEASKYGANKYEPTENNTGYLIGGSTYKDSYLETYDYHHVNFRFGKFAIADNISSCYSDSEGFFNVQTVNNQGENAVISSKTVNDKTVWTAEGDDTVLSKYSEVTNGLWNNSLKGSKSIWGIHFMDANLSTDNLVTAPWVSINNQTHTDYQMPANSIDFQLKEKGSINFMSGTYFSGDEGVNNSFFSLHQIIRDLGNESKVHEIRQIQAILRNDDHPEYPYVYAYKDGSYSLPYRLSDKGEKLEMDGVTPMEESYEKSSSKPTGYSSIFDVARIMKRNDLKLKKAYYFEVPVNEGEYALGSVSGGVGCYLMYLDIGASAKEINRTRVTEFIHEIQESFYFPLGVSLVATGTSSVDPTDSVCVLVRSGYVGTLTLQRDSAPEDQKVEVGGVYDSISPSFKGDGIELKSPTGEPLKDPKPFSRKTKTLRRLHFYDYSVNKRTLARVDFLDETLTSENLLTGETSTTKAQREIHRYYQDENSSWVEDTSELSDTSIVPIYRDEAEGEKKQGSVYESNELDSIQWNDPDASNVLVGFSYSYINKKADGTSQTEATFQYTLTLVDPDGDGYQTIQGFLATGEDQQDPHPTILITKEPSGTITVTISLNGTVVYPKA